MTTTADNLIHRVGCPANRVEVVEHPEWEVTTIGCLDCGSRWPDPPLIAGALAKTGDPE